MASSVRNESIRKLSDNERPIGAMDVCRFERLLTAGCYHNE